MYESTRVQLLMANSKLNDTASVKVTEHADTFYLTVSVKNGKVTFTSVCETEHDLYLKLIWLTIGLETARSDALK